jgi:2-dehydropantoate 2-reductase
MRIAVVGVGGVGGYFGGRLAQAGHAVYLIARGAHLKAIRAGGLRVTSIDGDFMVRPAGATDDPAQVGPVDLVLLAVKSWQLPEACASLGPLLGPDTLVLPLLNGVEAVEQVAAAVGAAHTLGGLCRIIAELSGPGQIRHSGIEPTIIFGELDNVRSPRAEKILFAIRTANIRVSIAADIQAAIWQKFMLVSTWSGLGAVTRTPIGVWRSLPQTRALATQMIAEVVAVASGRGVNLPPSAPENTMIFLDGVTPEGTASMQRDISEGRPSELEAQNGAVVRLGAAAGVPTPVNAFIYACLLPQEQQARADLKIR